MSGEGPQPMDLPPVGPAGLLSPRPNLRLLGRLVPRRGNLGLSLGILLVGSMAVLAIFAPLLQAHSPIHANSAVALQGPSSEYWFGTDTLGFDIFTRVLYAPRVDLVVPVIATAISFGIGVVGGAWLGYQAGRRGWKGFVSEHIMRFIDILQAFPVFVFALALVATLGRGETNIVYALVVLEAPIFLRLTRSSVQAVRQRTFVDAAVCAGNSERRIIFRHILPNSLGPALINASVLTGSGILITASLSFVGAGVQPPKPEWGYMVATGAENMVTGQWWPAVFPGLFIGLTVLGFALIGDAVAHRLNPDRRDRG